MDGPISAYISRSYIPYRQPLLCELKAHLLYVAFCTGQFTDTFPAARCEITRISLDEFGNVSAKYIPNR